MQAWFHGTKSECKDEVRKRNGQAIRVLEEDVAYLQAKIQTLRKANR